MNVISSESGFISAVLTAIYLFTAILPMYFNPGTAQAPAVKKDPSWRMLVPLGVLSLMIVGLGLFSQPLITFLRQISQGTIF